MNLAFAILAVMAYCLPTGIAILRRHENVTPIMVLNLAFGWTVLAWIAALALSFSRPKSPL